MQQGVPRPTLKFPAKKPPLFLTAPLCPLSFVLSPQAQSTTLAPPPPHSIMCLIHIVSVPALHLPPILFHANPSGVVR